MPKPKRATLPANRGANAPAPKNGETSVVAAGWAGPLPPPGALAQFNEIIPNGAERIMAMTEKEQAHRHKMDREGRRLGSVLLVVCLVMAAWCAYIGADWRVSLAFLSIPVLSVISRLFPSGK